VLVCAACAAHGKQYAWKKIPVLTDEFYEGEGVRGIPLHVDTGGVPYTRGEPVSGGIPLPKGELRATANARVLDAAKREMPSQVLPLAYWPDKSIKWLLVEFRLQDGRPNPTYFLEYGTRVTRSAAEAPIKVTNANGKLTIDTGVLRATIDKTRGSLLDDVRVDVDRNGVYEEGERVISGPVHSFLKLRDIEGDRGGTYSTLRDRGPEVVIEKHGSEEATVLIRAWHFDARGRRSCPVDARLTFFRNQPTIRLHHTFLVSENPAVVLLPSFGVEVPCGAFRHVATGVDGRAWEGQAEGVTVCQDSSESYWYPECSQFAPFCEILSSSRRPLFAGKKTDGWIQLRGPRRSVTVFMREMWQNFPKAYVYDRGTLRIELWPEAKNEAMNLRRLDQGLRPDYTLFMETESPTMRGHDYNMQVYHRHMTFEEELDHSAWGVGKSHDIWLRFGAADDDAAAFARRAARPLMPFVSPAWNSFTEAAGSFHPEDAANYGPLEKSWQMHVDTLKKHQREWFNWYGMWHWGNFQTDYFPKGYRFEGRRWNNFNTKYGWRNGGFCLPFGFYMRYLRAGGRGRFDMARQVTECLMDVSSRHPRAWSEGRLIPIEDVRRDWVGGGTRYDANVWGSGGRGYDSQHTWLIGMAMHFYLTGNFRARDVIEEYIDAAEKQSVFYERRLKYKVHDRREDMTTAVAAVAYELDPDNERYKRLFDAFAAHQAMGLRSLVVKKGKPVYSATSSVPDWHYRTYKGTSLMYMLAVKPVPELVDALLAGHPKTYGLNLANSGLMYYLCWKYSGNKNYARMASRFLQFGDYAGRDSVERDRVLKPQFFGYSMIEQCFIARGPYEIGMAENPLDLPGAARMRYPTGARGPSSDPVSDVARFVPVDMRRACNAEPIGQHAIGPANEDFDRGPVKFDFGPLDRVEPGWLPCDRWGDFPCTRRQFDEAGPFSDLPFGTTVRLRNVDFALVDPRGNDGRGVLVLRSGESATLPIRAAAKRIHLLTGVSLTEDPFHDKPGAEYAVHLADGTVRPGTLENMVHYQSRALLPLMFDPQYYAGTPSSYHLSVVSIDTGGKEVDRLTLKAAEADARVVIFAVSAECATPRPRQWVMRDDLSRSKAKWNPETALDGGRLVSKEKTDYRVRVPNGDYVLMFTADMDLGGCPLRALCNGAMVLSHVKPVAKTTYQTPARVTDGVLRLTLIPGEIHTKSRNGEAAVSLHDVSLHDVSLAKMSEGGILPAARRAPSGRKPLTYGWRLRGPRAILRERRTSDLKRDVDTYHPADNMMEDDDVYMITGGTMRGEFIVADVPKGTYEVTLFMRNPRSDGLVDIQIEDQLHENLRLRGAFPNPKHYHVMGKIETRPAYVVDVKDGTFNLAIDIKPKQAFGYRTWCVAGITMEKVR